jgi:hypothetical protein
MNFDFLFTPAEEIDAWLEGFFSGAPLVTALLIAFLLGLRHASDPDHLVAVTSLVAADGGDTRGAARLGAWWGFGHAAALVALGLPLIFLKGELPAWLETGAERAVGAARGRSRSRRVRADVDRFHGALHQRVRLGAHAARHRPPLQDGADPGARPVRSHVRHVVRRHRLGRLRSRF